MKWQYKEMRQEELEDLGKTCSVKQDKLTISCSALNLMGDEEWELMWVSPDGIYIFKKPVPVSFVQGA